MRAAFTIRPTDAATSGYASVEVSNAFGDGIAKGVRTLKAMGWTWVWVTATEREPLAEDFVRALNCMAEQLVLQPGIVNISFTMEV